MRIFITAQEIIVDNASYPIKEIAENSHIFRTLGLGYANLGSLIMSYGLGYDSDEGRALAGAITAIMTGHAYEQSARMAAGDGAVPRLSRRALQRRARSRSRRTTSSPMLEVIELHRDAVDEIQASERVRLSQGRSPPSAGTTRSRSARSTATATRRSPCSRPPAPSAS